MQFNLCMEPWLKYAMHLVADQGLQRSQWTSARLLRDVLYVETARCCFNSKCGEQKWGPLLAFSGTCCMWRLPYAASGCGVEESGARWNGPAA